MRMMGIMRMMRMMGISKVWITMMLKLMMPGFVMATVLPQRERSVQPNLAQVDFFRFVTEILY